MQHSDTFAAIAAALAGAQGEFPPIPRDRKVTVKMKAKPDGTPGGQYDFHYAPLETILEKVRKPLAANGLSLVQSIVLEETGNGGAVEVLRTTLLHSSGEWFANDVPIFHGTGDNKSQAYASGVTYSRRYGVTMLLCVAADADDDGNGGDQDRGGPDYERNEGREPYRGTFPRGGGRQQDRQAPKPPQRRSAAQAPAEHQDHAAAAEDARAEPGAADGATPWGEDLTQGQVAMLRAAALAGGFDDAAVLELVGGEPVTAATFKAAQSALKAAVNAKLDR